MSGEAKPRPRLLVLTSTLPRRQNDGEPAFVLELARRLTDAFDVRILAPHSPGAATREQIGALEIHRYRYAPGGWETLTYGGGLLANLKRQPWKWLLVPLLFAAQYFAIRKAVRHWQPAVVHAHWLIPQGLIAAFALGRKHRQRLVTTSHGADLYALRGATSVRLKRFVVRRSDAITVVSRAMRERVVALGAPAERVSVAPMGTDLTRRFTLDESESRSADEILSVGRLVEKKGLRYLLDAMPEILRARSAAQLLIAGFGPEQERLKAQARALNLEDRVTFLGPVPQDVLAVLYRRAAVFVAPFIEAASGDQEGLGLVVVEAIGCGCPVVVSDLPAVRDVLDDDAAAFRVEPGSARALADAVVDVLQNPDVWRVRTAALRERIAKQFDWNAVAAQYRALLREPTGDPGHALGSNGRLEARNRPQA